MGADALTTLFAIFTHPYLLPIFTPTFLEEEYEVGGGSYTINTLGINSAAGVNSIVEAALQSSEPTAR